MTSIKYDPRLVVTIISLKLDENWLKTKAEVVNEKFNSLTTKQQTTKFSSAIFFLKNVKSKLYHIGNSKTRGKTG